MDYKYIVNGKPSYYSMNNEDRLYMLSVIDKYTKKNNRSSRILRSIESEVEFKRLIEKYYVENTIGIKSLVKFFEGKISYSALRYIIKNLGFLNEGCSHKFSDAQKAMRKYNCQARITKTWSENCSVYRHQHLIANNKQGIQGYYFSKMMNKYIWLKSTFEYGVAKWLDDNNILYQYEGLEYKLKDGRRYRPDFIFKNEDGNITSILEIKSTYYVSHQDDKGYLLQHVVNYPVVVILGYKGVMEYLKMTSEYSYTNMIKEWKRIRRTKDDLNKN